MSTPWYAATYVNATSPLASSTRTTSSVDGRPLLEVVQSIEHAGAASAGIRPPLAAGSSAWG